MSPYSLTEISGPELRSHLDTAVAKERGTVVEVLTLIGEVDERKEYLVAGYASMYHYCLHHLRYSDQAALKRLRVARAARQYPSILTALADGRLSMSAVVLLAPLLKPETAADLLAAVDGKSKSEIEEIVAGRSPRPTASTRIRPLGPEPEAQPSGSDPLLELGRDPVPLSPGTVEIPPPTPPPAKVAPLSPQRYALQVTIEQQTHDNLRYAQALLRHAVPTGDVATILDRALTALIQQLEKRKFAATLRPRTAAERAAERADERARHIPAAIKRAVWERDEGRCTYVGDTGRPCAALDFLEFDHIHPVARGGPTTIDNLRLRCRAHNQYEAERTLGAEFMQHKRRRAAAPPSSPPTPEWVHDVMAGLRSLGVRVEEAKRAVAQCYAMPPSTPIEERMRTAIQSLARRTVMAAAT